MPVGLLGGNSVVKPDDWRTELTRLLEQRLPPPFDLVCEPSSVRSGHTDVFIRHPASPGVGFTIPWTAFPMTPEEMADRIDTDEHIEQCRRSSVQSGPLRGTICRRPSKTPGEVAEIRRRARQRNDISRVEQTYTVVEGDTVEGIAQRHGFENHIERFVGYNGWASAALSLSPGDVVHIPPGGRILDKS